MSVTGVEASIADNLLWRLSQLVSDPVMPVANPNIEYDTQSGVPYLKAEVMFNTSVGMIPYDSDVTVDGLFQVSVFWPANEGTIKPMQVASLVVALFTRGTRIVRNNLDMTFEQQPRVATAIQEPDWVQVPVIIRWRVTSPAH